MDIPSLLKSNILTDDEKKELNNITEQYLTLLDKIKTRTQKSVFDELEQLINLQKSDTPDLEHCTANCTKNDDINKIFRQLSIIYHPDRGGDTISYQKIVNLRDANDIDALKDILVNGFTECDILKRYHSMVKCIWFQYSFDVKSRQFVKEKYTGNNCWVCKPSVELDDNAVLCSSCDRDIKYIQHHVINSIEVDINTLPSNFHKKRLLKVKNNGEHILLPFPIILDLDVKYKKHKTILGKKVHMYYYYCKLDLDDIFRAEIYTP